MNNHIIINNNNNSLDIKNRSVQDTSDFNKIQSEIQDKKTNIISVIDE